MTTTTTTSVPTAKAAIATNVATMRARIKAGMPSPQATAKAAADIAPVAPPKTAYVPEAQHDVPEKVDPLLVTILAWPRKHNSASEAAFQVWLKDTLTAHGTVTPHSEGALSITMPTNLPDQYSTTLFSCHTDTIDPLVPLASDPLAKKMLTYDPNFGLIGLDKASVGDSLGADDGIGVWIMLSMIAAKVPGTYLFNRGEECGGVSAKALAYKESKWLAMFEACIAFDRPRTNEVITHQGGKECASDKFAAALCKQLNDKGFQYAPSDRGVYTDNKEFRKEIAECVNLGVGYESQHGRQETQDYAHAYALKEACLVLDWDTLPIDRDPAKPDPVPAYKAYADYGSYGKGKWGGYDKPGSSLWDDDDLNDGWRADAKDLKPKATPAKAAPPVVTATCDDFLGMSLEDIRWTCTEEPEITLEIVVALMRENARLKADVATLEAMVGV